MKNLINKLDKISKDENPDPVIKNAISKKKETILNNKTVKK